MSDVDTLYDFSTELLTACEAALSTTIGGTPDRSYITVEAPSLDCPEQLTVHVASLAMDPRLAGPQQGTAFQTNSWRNIASVVATIVRCTPQPQGLSDTTPALADLEALARKTQQDVWAIWNYVAGLLADGALFEGKCRPYDFQVARALPESGTSAGWVFTANIAVDGYAVTI